MFLFYKSNILATFQQPFSVSGTKHSKQRLYRPNTTKKKMGTKEQELGNKRERTKITKKRNKERKKGGRAKASERTRENNEKNKQSIIEFVLANCPVNFPLCVQSI